MKYPVALLINDIHVSKDNISEFELNWSEALSICEKENIDDIVIGGDIFTSRASQTLATLLAVKEALERATKKGLFVTIAEGNHDKVDQEAIKGYNHLWTNIRNVEVADEYKALAWENCNFVLLVMSYFPENGSFLERLEEATKKILIQYPIHTKKDIILYIHEGVHGALGDFEIEGELPQEPLTEYRAVLCGHYHNRTKIKGTNIEYIGSSRQNNFGEDENKGYTILFDDGTYEFVQNKVNFRYQTIEIDADALDQFDFEKDELYKYRIKVKCTDKQAKTFNKQKLLDLGFNKVEVVADTPVISDVTMSDIQEKYDKSGIKKEYQNYCNDNDIDSELGMKYLEG